MILLIEIQCKGWEHNRVNAGFIRQIMMAFPQEQIKLYADSEHIKGIENFLEEYGMRIESKPVEFFDYHDKNYARADEYANILKSIIKDNIQTRGIVLLSCNKGIIQSMNNVCPEFPNVFFYLVLHGALEEVCHEPEKIKLCQHIYRLLWSIKHGRMHPGYSNEISMKDCIEKCEADNCRYISYSPCFRDELAGHISSEVIEKISFFHLAFYEGADRKKTEEKERIAIGLYGQAVNENAIRIINEYNNKYDNGSVLFYVLTSDESEVLGLKNVIRLNDEEHVSDEKLVDYIKSFDYILVPYDKDQYKVCSSGIFYDAISHEIPLLMLDSPHLRYYSKYGIGILANNIEKMAKVISELNIHRDDVNNYKKKENELKTTSLNDNVYALSDLFSGYDIRNKDTKHAKYSV